LASPQGTSWCLKVESEFWTWISQGNFRKLHWGTIVRDDKKRLKYLYRRGNVFFWTGQKVTPVNPECILSDHGLLASHFSKKVAK
jgi:hypothetical protein